MKILQINTTINTGSTGRIAEDIGQILLSENQESYIAFGRNDNQSKSKKIKIGTKKDFYNHILISRFLDQHGFGSKKATQRLVKEIENVNPDIIHLHNVHGYYLHISTLFNFLSSCKTPIVWTFHDCWPFTGHCAHFERVGCIKWQTHCKKCPLTHSYPKSILIDNSFNNFNYKKEAFTGLENLYIITPSKWLESLVKKSFLKEYPVKVIYNGIDLDTFKPLRHEDNKRNKKHIVLGVASVWSKSKGLEDFLNLRKKIRNDIDIILIGLSQKQIKQLPSGIKGIERTENILELVEWYNNASIFVNPTYADTFPTTNLEALACGTPVITYKTGGSPEAIDSNTGAVVEKGDIEGLVNAIESILRKDINLMGRNCRHRAQLYFNKEERLRDYLHLYHQVLNTREA